MWRSLGRLVLVSLVLCASGAAADIRFDRNQTRTLTQTDAGGANESGDEFGAALAAGDLDGDGYDDLVVGAPSDGGAGTVFVFPGGPTGFAAGLHRFESDAERGGVPSPEVAGDFFGAVVAVGNFDADPQRELVVGAPGRASNAGAVFVFQGAAGSGVLGATGVWFDSSQLGCGAATAGDGFGTTLAVGDFNGDGYDDLVIGAPGASSNAGKICVVPGSFSGLVDGTGAAYFEDTNGYVPSAVEPGDRFGAALAVGHFTNDAYADLVIGAPGEAPGADPAGGSVAVWFGKNATSIGDFFASGISFIESNAPSQVVEAGDAFGQALATAAASGSPDRLYIGAPGDPGGAGSGLVFPFYFTFGTTSTQYGLPLSQTYLCCVGPAEANENGDGYGGALAAGDVDGNGYDELLVGVPSEDGGTGMVMLYSDSSLAGFALARSYRPDDVLPTDGVSHAGSYFGEALASGDFHGDGRREFAIGAPVEQIGGQSSGAVYVAPEPNGSGLGLAAAVACALLSAGSRRRRSSSSSR